MVFWTRLRAEPTPSLPTCASLEQFVCGMRGCKDRAFLDGNPRETLVPAPFLDELAEQVGKLVRDGAFPRAALPCPLLQGRHQEPHGGRPVFRRQEVPANEHRDLAGPRPGCAQGEQDGEVLRAHPPDAMGFARGQSDGLQLRIGEGPLGRVVRANRGPLDVARYLDAVEEVQDVGVDPGVAAFDAELQERRHVAEIVQILVSEA